MEISIIIPTYTAVNYLNICLESIYKNQFNKNNEIVLVIDGKSNLFEGLIEKYQHKLNLKSLVFEENKGLAIATNYGFYNSSNKLCLNINDDNVCPLNFDKILIEEYQNQQNHFPCSNLLIVPNQIEPKPSIFNPLIIKDYGDLNKFD